MARRNKPKKQASAPGPFVAIHPEVSKDLGDWAENHYRPTAEKVLALISQLLQQGNEGEVQQSLRRLCQEPVKKAPAGTIELGPKQQRGGAPRLFLFRKFGAAFLIASDIEKGSGGTRRGLDRARARAGEIEKIFSQTTPRGRHPAAKSRDEAIEELENGSNGYQIVRPQGQGSQQ